MPPPRSTAALLPLLLAAACGLDDGGGKDAGPAGDGAGRPDAVLTDGQSSHEGPPAQDLGKTCPSGWKDLLGKAYRCVNAADPKHVVNCLMEVKQIPPFCYLYCGEAGMSVKPEIKDGGKTVVFNSAGLIFNCTRN